MVVLAVDQIFWTRETEEALRAGGAKGLAHYREKCVAQLDAIVERVRAQLSKLQRKTLGSVVTLDVHGRDVLLTMEAAGVAIANDFDWMAQLRYYYAPELSQEIQVRMITWLGLGLASNPNPDPDPNPNPNSNPNQVRLPGVTVVECARRGEPGAGGLSNTNPNPNPNPNPDSSPSPNPNPKQERAGSSPSRGSVSTPSTTTTTEQSRCLASSASP